MRPAARIAMLAVATVFASLALAATASANFIASGPDPAGDASDPSPGRDLTDIAVAYDRRTGELSGSIRLRGAPRDERSFVTLAAGMRTATGCDGYPAGVLSAYTDDIDGTWLRLDAPGAPSAAHGPADKTGFKGQDQSFSAQAAALAHRPFNCAIALLSEPGNSANVYDIAGPFRLVGQPALGLSIRRVPKRLKIGRTRTIRLVLTNTGDGPTRPMNLRIGRARGLSAKPRMRRLGRLAPGRHRAVLVKVRLSRRARSETHLRVVARAGHLVVRGDAPIEAIKPRKRPRKGNGGGDSGGTPSSCIQYQPDPFGTSGGSLVLVPC